MAAPSSVKRRLSRRKRQAASLLRGGVSRFGGGGSRSALTSESQKQQASPPVARKKMMTTPLHKMCAPGLNTYSIDAIISYLRSHPKDALAVDKRGMTPLHTVLARLPHRNDIASLLIGVAPEACDVRDRDGMVPLHHAAMNANSVASETFKLLLKRDAERDSSSTSPSSSTSSSPPSSSGSGSSSLGCPSRSCSALIRDKRGDTPFGLYCDVLERTVTEEFFKSSSSQSSSSSEFLGVLRYGSLLVKSVPIVTAIAWGEPTVLHDGGGGNNNNGGGNNNPWEGMLHAALYAIKRATSSEPSSMAEKNDKNGSFRASANEVRRYKFLLRSILRKSHKSCSKRDRRGNLPLHVAASIPYLNEPPGRNSSERLVPAPFTDDAREGVIDALVRLYPRGCKEKNGVGLLPFDVAERNGCGWRSGGVMTLIRNNKDVLPHLSVGRSNGRKEEGAVPALLGRLGKYIDADAVFEVLRERPEVLLRQKLY